ncbi:WSSV306 [White spot syndrome virus]|uniref:WSSV306 n=1 Tax=White spot syndrome virus TaxID=342409 RepID=A0A2I6SC24_9VIRU|nr:WSSV306 [White spot syndrome virus]
MNSLRIDAINGKIEEVYNPSPIMGIREYGTIRRAGTKKMQVRKNWFYDQD